MSFEQLSGNHAYDVTLETAVDDTARYFEQKKAAAGCKPYDSPSALAIEVAMRTYGPEVVRIANGQFTGNGEEN